MFNYINGMVSEILPNIAVLDCGGVGFEINTTAYTLSQIKAGEKAKLYIFTYIKEDVFSLFGFATRSEKRCFEMLIGVSGVGPRAALSILSSMSPENLMMNIIAGNDKVLTTAPGVGKKLAGRIILELKDKMAKETGEISFRDMPEFTPALGTDNSKMSDAVAALAVLGYGTAEINSALKHIDVDAMSLEQIIKAALKQMMK